MRDKTSMLEKAVNFRCEVNVGKKNNNRGYLVEICPTGRKSQGPLQTFPWS